MKRSLACAAAASLAIAVFLQTGSHAGDKKATPFKPILSVETFKLLTERSSKRIDGLGKAELAKANVESAIASGYVPPRRAPYSFRFESCAAALLSYRARLREMAELVKALAIGELEADGRYVESRHDELFAGFDAESLRAEDFAMFPDYLVTLEDGGEASEAGLIEALSSGAPS